MMAEIAQNQKISQAPFASGEVERERLTSLINSMADGVIAVDEDGTIVLYNGAALNILNVNSSMTGQKLSHNLKLIDANKQPIDIHKVVLGTKTQFTNREWRILYAKDDTANLYISIAPVSLGYGEDGKKGFVILIRDITHEKSLEEERDEFISVVSHELRTPIAIAEGNVSNAEFILEKAGVTDKGVVEALKQAHTQINFLSGMINDLSTLSRAERGVLEVEAESINVSELIVELTSTYGPSAKQKSLTLDNEIASDLEVLHSAKLYVREILQNFVTNSIKYTEKGSVTIGARAGSKGVEFYVRDTGIGISKADKERVFDKFFRSEDFRTRQNNGTGLGLYVTMKLAKLIHAELTVDSEINVGSTFTIFIPDLK
jgi:PAS domain S-box-containing protein